MTTMRLPEAPTLAHPMGGLRRKPTARQLQTLDWIRAFVATNGCPPTIREIGSAFGIRSTNAVNDRLRQLERHGLIEKVATRSRSIRLLDHSTKEERLVRVLVKTHENVFAEVRARLGMSAEQISALLHSPAATFDQWECGAPCPRTARLALAFLLIQRVATDPIFPSEAP